MFSKVFHEKTAETDFSKELGFSNAKGLKHLKTVIPPEKLEPLLLLFLVSWEKKYFFSKLMGKLNRYETSFSVSR